MYIKKFTAKNEIEATEAARKELGDGLVIMNVRKVKPTGSFAFLRHKMVEVTAAIEDEPEEPLRQIRRIAEAQEAKQRQAAAKKAAGNAPEKPSAPQTAQAPRESLIGRKEPAAPVAAEPGSIEEKLDTLQNLLETQFHKENAVLSEARERGEAVSEGLSETGEEEPESPEDKHKQEMDRFIRLLYNTMLDNEVDEHLANEIIQEAEIGRGPNAGIDFILSTIYQKMILRFGKSEGIRSAESGPKIIFFIGPTGVGKTTTIAKIASSLSVNDKEKVALLTTDTYRIAATDQLRTYASILGVPFRVIYSSEELGAAVEDFRDCSYIFVDTAGHSHHNEQFLDQQKEYLESLPDTLEQQSFLVVSATTKLKDLRKIVDNYKGISDFQLIFTKLDETSSLGNLYNIRQYAGKPIAYVTCGQNVPDDIEVFNAQKTVKQLLSETAL